MKAGTSRTWKHGLYALAVNVTKVTASAYTIQATITTDAIVQEPVAYASNSTNHYFLFGDSTLNSSRYTTAYMGSADYLYQFGDKNLTCTMTMEIPASSCKAGWNALGFKVEPWNVANVADATYYLEFLQAPTAPYISSSHASSGAKATKNSLKLALGGRSGTVVYQYRAKGAKKWSNGKTSSDMFTLKKLKSAKAYQVRIRNVVVSANMSGTITTLESNWSGVTTLNTAPSATPKISSTKITNAKSSRYWRPGYWTSYSRTGHWVSGRYVTTTGYTVTIKLAKKIKGANGVLVKYGSMTQKLSLGKDGRTITFRGSGAGIGKTQSFKVCAIANPSYDNNLIGATKWSKAKSAVVRA